MSHGGPYSRPTMTTRNESAAQANTRLVCNRKLNRTSGGLTRDAQMRSEIRASATQDSAINSAKTDQRNASTASPQILCVALAARPKALLMRAARPIGFMSTCVTFRSPSPTPEPTPSRPKPQGASASAQQPPIPAEEGAERDRTCLTTLISTSAGIATAMTGADGCGNCEPPATLKDTVRNTRS